jgi:hypothetical protein
MGFAIFGRTVAVFRNFHLRGLKGPDAIISFLRGISGATWLGCAGVALLFIALRWQQYDAPLIRDEGEYVYAAQLLGRGSLPYEHSFLQKPPMCIYSYALANLVAPNVFWFPRIIAYAFAGLATLVLGLIARINFGRGTAVPVMWLATPMILLPALPMTIAVTEMFLLLPLLSLIALCTWSQRHGSSSFHWFLGGCLGAITLAYKYTVIPIVLVVYVGWSVAEWHDSHDRGRLLQRWFACLLGAVLSAAVAFLPFLLSDGGRHVWECTVEFNRAYAASSNFGFARLLPKLKMFCECWPILFVLPCLLLIWRRSRMWLWFALFLAAWLATSGSYYIQYYVPLMPFWALLAGVALVQATERLAKKLSVSPAGLGRIVIAAVVISLCVPSFAPLIARARTSQAFNALNPFPESQIVAKRIAALTSPNEFVYVAGSEPQLLAYAQRQSPTRFVIAYPMMIPSRLAVRFQQEAIQDLERRPPALIVVARSNTSWLKQPGTPMDFADYLQSLLETRYERVGGYVLEADHGCWQEPLTAGEECHCSLVIYRHRPETSESAN